MRVRTRHALVAALSLGLLVTGRSGFAGPNDHKFVSVHGRVVDAAGAPLADVRVEAHGTREAVALTDAAGRYQLSLDLGTLRDLRDRPVSLAVHAGREGWRIEVAGGAPALALELSVNVAEGKAQMVARSNFGLIADALLDALAPPGDRTAVIQTRFVAERGAGPDTTAAPALERRVADLVEPWLVAAPPAPPAAAAPPPAVGRPPVAAAPAPASTHPPAGAPPPATAVPPATARPPAPGAGPASTPATAHSPASTPAPGVGPAVPPPAAEPKPRAEAQAKKPSPRDSLRLAHQAEEQRRAAEAQAARDLAWRVRHQASLAHKAQVDSLRAVRDAAEDSARRAHFGLPPRPLVEPAPKSQKPPQQVMTPPSTSPPASGGSEHAAPAVKPPARSRGEPKPASPRSASSRENPGSLQRIEPGGQPDSVPAREGGAHVYPDTSSCGCRVRGTVELESHRLLANPMRLEVAIPELPAMRDTIELFMGSPRAFEFLRVPCGRLSLAVRAFAQRPFVVVTPDEVAPFDCRDREMRQVRVVIAPR
jgi:hypothetical protein